MKNSTPPLDTCLHQHLSNENNQLIAGLPVYASLDVITQRATEIADDMIDLINVNKVATEVIWVDFCCLIDKKPGITPQSPRKLKKRVREELLKAVKLLTFRQQASDSIPNKYVSDRFASWLSTLSKKGYSYYENALFSHAKYRRQSQATSQKLARASGLASLAMKDDLKPYFFTITLDSQYHRNSHKWNGMTADESAKLLNKTHEVFNDMLRNNKIKCEEIKIIEACEDGTPHMQGLIFTDSPDRCLSLIKKAFVDKAGVAIEDGIYFERARNVKRCIHYLLKTFWGPLKYQNDGDDEMIAWADNLSVRRFSLSSRMRKLAPVYLWEQGRKGQVWIQSSASAISINIDINNDGEVTYRAGHNFSGYCLGDVNSEVNNALNDSAFEGDFANFTRIYNDVTNTRKIPQAYKNKGIETISVLDEKELTELRTISQDRGVLSMLKSTVFKKIIDYEDHNYLLNQFDFNQNDKYTEFIHLFKINALIESVKAWHLTPSFKVMQNWYTNGTQICKKTICVESK